VSAIWNSYSDALAKQPNPEGHEMVAGQILQQELEGLFSLPLLFLRASDSPANAFLPCNSSA
jgi:hypothetical protein